MLNSVRIRLTLWYTAAMTIVLLVLAAATYFVFRENVVHRADSQAVELADSFLSTVDAEERDVVNPESAESAIEAAIAEHRFADVVFVVFDANENLLGISDIEQQPGRRSNAPQEALAASVKHLISAPAAFRSVKFAERPYRSYVRHFSVEHQPATLIVLQSLRRQKEFLQTLAETFGAAIPLAILLAGAGGYLLARRSLSPVVAMSSQASLIGAENLHERLASGNPGDELGQLAGSFNGLLDRLDQSFERQKRFVADASHELRTPVAILCGEAEVTLSQEKRSDAEYRESLKILKEEANRLRHIVEDLFTLARADAGRHPLSLSDFYLDELVAECVKSIRTLASAKKITVTCDSHAEAPIHGDEVLIRRMLINLLYNAIKYTGEGGRVAVRCGEENGVYRLSVQDSGTGIPADLQGKIFERFFRVDKARSRQDADGGGAGLGLSIASWIASAHGGSVALTRSDPEGSEFTVLLPKTAPQS
jgi:two-component system, OmpR family, sensor kinase